MLVFAGRHDAQDIQVSTVSNVGDEEVEEPHPILQIECSNSGGVISPLVIDLEMSPKAPAEGGSTSTPSSIALMAFVEQTSELLSATETHVELTDVSDLPVASECTVSTEETAVMDSEIEVVDLTVTPSQSCPVTTDASTGVQSGGGTADTTLATSQTLAAAVLSEEYRKRYEKYKNLCSLITMKDRELVDLNDERKRLHQRLVDLERAILVRPVTHAAVDGPSSSAVPPPKSREVAATDEDREDRDPSKHGRVAAATAMTAAVAFRHRPAHRGVTSVRVMVKSAQPPVAHSTKINLSRYNSLFCNYDDASGRRRLSTEVSVSNEDVASSIRPTDLSVPSSERTTKLVVSSDEIVEPPALAVAKPCRTLDGTAAVSSFLHTTDKNPSEYADVGYAAGRVVSQLSPTVRGRIELAQSQLRSEDDGCQNSNLTLLESYRSRHEIAPVSAAENMTVSHDSGPSVACAVPVDSQRVARQIADLARHQPFVMATTNDMILSTARGRVRNTDDQRSVVSSAYRPELSLVTSATNHRSACAEVEVPPPPVTEPRPPPPYPRYRLRPHHAYPATAAPGLSPRDRSGAGFQLSHRAPLNHGNPHTAIYTYRKENPAGPRTVYVQPMRAENQASVVIHPSSAGTAGRETDEIVFRQPCSDISPKGNAVSSDAIFLGNRLSPPVLPLRVGGRVAYDQQPIDNSHRDPAVSQAHYLHHATADVAQTRHRNNDGYHGNCFSNPQTSRPTADGAHQQLTHPPTNAEQRHVTMMRDVVDRFPVERRPLDQLQHFVDGRRIPPEQPLALDSAGDPQLLHLSPPSPGLMASGHFGSNVDGRMYGPAGAVVGADFSKQDAAVAAVPLQVRPIDFHAQIGPAPRLPHSANAPPPPPPLQPDLTTSQSLPRRVLPHSVAAGLPAAPLDMSAASKQRRYPSANQVTVITVDP